MGYRTKQRTSNFDVFLARATPIASLWLFSPTCSKPIPFECNNSRIEKYLSIIGNDCRLTVRNH